MAADQVTAKAFETSDVQIDACNLKFFFLAHIPDEHADGFCREFFQGGVFRLMGKVFGQRFTVGANGLRRESAFRGDVLQKVFGMFQKKVHSLQIYKFFGVAEP